MTLAGYSSTYFWYTDMLRSLFAKQLDVTNMGLFWQFAENDLLDGLYWETWYNKGYKKADVLCPDGVRATHPCKVHGCQMAIRCKIWSLPSLDCARVEDVGAQRKERKGSNFAV